MVLLLHILIALASVAYATYVFFQPSKTRLHVSYALVATTLTSGFYLVVSHPAHLMQACLTGLMYLGVVAVFIASAHYQLARLQK